MERKILATAASFGLTATILGAFGAHLLKEKIGAEMTSVFETGVRYQFYSTFFLLFLGLYGGIGPARRRWAFYCCAIGTIFFSGSIYLLATNALTAFDFRAIGFVTPLGGLLLMVAWLLLLVDFIGKKS